MAVSWTKLWTGADDGTIVGGVDLGNLQNDLALVLQTSDIGSTVQAQDAALDLLSTPSAINPANLVKNGAFDTFGAPPTPDDWVVEGGGTEAQETTDVQIGANAYSITSDADGSASRQTILSTIGASDNTYFQNKYVTLTARVYTGVTTNARIAIDDGVTVENSSYHTGTTGWETLTITAQISASATKLDVILKVDGNAQEAKFDAVRLNCGQISWEFTHHRSDA
jgi:hypothetical protein